MIARAEKELRTNVDCSLFIGRHENGCVPVEAQLLFVVSGLRLDIAAVERMPVDAANGAALRFGVNPVRIGGIGEYPEAVTAIQVLPARVADSARIRRVAHPGAVVLQSTVDAVRIIIINADVVELRDR